MVEYLISKINNWEEFIKMSTLHGVLPLVYKNLKKYQNEIPKDVFSKIKMINMDIVKRNMLMTAELLKVMKLLQENNIESIAFKGPTLSEMAYGDVVSRQYVDLDLFIKIDDIELIQNILKEYNYKMLLDLNEFETDFRKKHSHELSMINELKNVHIELHWNFLDNDNPINLKGLEPFNDINKLSINNSILNSFNIEKLLIYLCVHGASHLYERIEWIIDIDKLINKNSIDWAYFDKLVNNCFEVKNSIYFSLYYSHKILGTNIPKEYINDNYNIFLKKILKTSKNNNLQSDILLKTRLYSSFTNKIKFLYKVTFKPTLNEIRYIKLNDNFYFLYYFIRIFLTIRNFIYK